MLSCEQFDHVMAQATNAAYVRAIEGAKQDECVKAAEYVAVAALAALEKLKGNAAFGSVVDRVFNTGGKS